MFNALPFLSTLPSPLHAPHLLYLSAHDCHESSVFPSVVLLFECGFSVVSTFICSISQKKVCLFSFRWHRYTFFSALSLHSLRCLPACSVSCVCFRSIVTMEQYTSFHCPPLRALSRPFTPTASLTPRIMMPVTVYVVASDAPFG